MTGNTDVARSCGGLSRRRRTVKLHRFCDPKWHLPWYEVRCKKFSFHMLQEGPVGGSTVPNAACWDARRRFGNTCASTCAAPADRPAEDPGCTLRIHSVDIGKVNGLCMQGTLGLPQSHQPLSSSCAGESGTPCGPAALEVGGRTAEHQAFHKLPSLRLCSTSRGRVRTFHKHHQTCTVGGQSAAPPHMTSPWRRNPCRRSTGRHMSLATI
jgi:hypothetical protein